MKKLLFTGVIISLYTYRVQAEQGKYNKGMCMGFEEIVNSAPSNL